MICLTLPELLHIAGHVLGGDPPVRDIGLLESAAARPRAAAFGAGACPGLESKAAALLHSLARNRALAGGSRRLALAAVIAFYGVSGRRLTLTSDDAYDLVIEGPNDRATRKAYIALTFLLRTTERAATHSLQFGTYALWTAGLLAALTVRPVPSCIVSLPYG